jgi:hypothetical protein
LFALTVIAEAATVSSLATIRNDPAGEGGVKPDGESVAGDREGAEAFPGSTAGHERIGRALLINADGTELVSLL